MKNKLVTSVGLIICLIIIGDVFGQEIKVKPFSENHAIEFNAGQKSSVLTTPLYKEITHSENIERWAVTVKPSFSREHSTQKLKEIKESKIQVKKNSFSPSEEAYKSMVEDPEIGTNFEANWTIVGTPPDNTLAISNDGYIVTANNDGIEYYDESGSFLYFDYWSDFFNDDNLNATIYDPKLIYDSGVDRFVLVVLHGYTPSTSRVLVCFSKSNNPQDGWWVYQITGNPLNNDCWFDYPSLGVSNNEIYVTGNLFDADDEFNQAVVYQIPKSAGYEGNNFNWQYWSNLSSSPFEAFTLVPASYGHEGNYGPGIYIISNESSGENKLRLWDLTDDMDGSPSLNSYTIDTDSYSPAANSLQLGNENDALDNGDCRVQNAFYLDGIVHFVFHSDIGQGWNGINYNRLTVSNLTNQSSTLGLEGTYDYSYPAVVPFSNSISDKSVMIAFLRSYSTIYPEVRVINCDNDMQWSASTLVKEGETFVDFLEGDERWGDYTGISRRHNSEDPTIWLAGCYGANIESQEAYNTYKTWIAEVFSESTVSLDEVSAAPSFELFPNPAYNLIHIRFTTEDFEKTTIRVLDAQGKIVRVLYDGYPKVGENKLSFNKNALTAGTYFVNISTSSKMIKNEKLVILD